MSLNDEALGCQGGNETTPLLLTVGHFLSGDTPGSVKFQFPDSGPLLCWNLEEESIGHRCLWGAFSESLPGARLGMEMGCTRRPG